MPSFIRVSDVIAGTTIRPTWVSSGVTPTGIFSRVLDSSETLVSSIAGVSSGNGFYYGVHTLPNSPGWFVNEWQATIDSYVYINRQFIRARTLEVD